MTRTLLCAETQVFPPFFKTSQGSETPAPPAPAAPPALTAPPAPTAPPTPAAPLAPKAPPAPTAPPKPTAPPMAEPPAVPSLAPAPPLAGLPALELPPTVAVPPVAPLPAAPACGEVGAPLVEPLPGPDGDEYDPQATGMATRTSAAAGARTATRKLMISKSPGVKSRRDLRDGAVHDRCCAADEFRNHHERRRSICSQCKQRGHSVGLTNNCLHRSIARALGSGNPSNVRSIHLARRVRYLTTVGSMPQSTNVIDVVIVKFDPLGCRSALNRSRL